NSEHNVWKWGANDLPLRQPWQNYRNQGCTGSDHATGLGLWIRWRQQCGQHRYRIILLRLSQPLDCCYWWLGDYQVWLRWSRQPPLAVSEPYEYNLHVWLI